MSGFHGQSRIPPGVEDNEEDPATPHVRRKSFLLSVINSTTRPRLSFPTPHPHALGHSNPANAYAGATPGPKSSLHFRQARRSSHPLAQAHVFNPITPSAARSSALADGVSPAGSSASFLSTASSHDLTVHARVNASFDPVTGLQGVGRFNATKLNTYLHGLNRRLQEENEVLLERLRIQQDENMRLMIKQGGSGELSGVAEDATAEGWVLEREVLERQVEDLRSAVQAREDEKVQLESQLDDERVQRMKDKDRWKERMTEVEQGVSDIVQELERKLGAAESAIIDCEKEIKEKTMHLDIANEEKRILVDRAENAERIIGSKKESGEELRDAYGKMSQLSSDLQVANVQIEQLRGDLSLAIESKNEAQAISDASTKTSQDLQSKIKDLKLATQSSEARVKELENQNRAFDEELNDLKAYVDKLESHALEAADRIETLEQQLSMVSEDNERLLTERRDRDEKIKRLDEAAFTAEESALRMTEALAECEKKIVTDEEEIAALVAKIGSKDVGKGGPQDLEKPHSSNADIEALESELDQADKEIARLNNLLQQSPARKAIDKAKDARIAMLERDKEELLERVRALKNTASPFATPTRGFHGSAMSPMHKHLLTMRTPRTPGGPLNDLSWLQNVTQAASTSPLLAEISRLQKELDQANESIDDKLDKLEEAGLGVVQLTKLLQDARARITGMEGDIAALRRKDARRLRRMHKIRCAKCHSTMDVSALSRWLDQDDNSAEVSADISQNHMLDKVEVLQTELQAVNRQLERLKDEWDDEKRRLLAENDGLHDTARRLNQEIRDAKKIVLDAERSANRVKSGSQVDLDRAKRTIADLEDELRSERSQLRSIVTQQARAVREKTDISSQLQKAEAELSDVKLQLLSAKQRNSEMELEQRAHAKAGQNSQLLESKLEKNSKLIEQLRGETSLLSDEKASLQRQLSRATQEIEEMGRKNAASQSALEDRRHQLDSYSAQIDELRSKLAAQKNERQGVQHTIDSLESDLRRVRNDAEVFGSDLRLLRTEKERIEAKYRAELESQEQLQMQSQTKIRMLQEELAQQRSSAGKYAQTSEEQLSSAYGESVELLRAQHNKECKGLIVQIRYLKAKFTRESSLRSDLGYQKQYLLILLSKYETSEKRILASISQIGYPAQKPERVKRRSLKVMVLLAIFVVRTKRASAEWQDQRSCRKDIADALTVVRKRRIEGL
ncbi:hypothetical protein BD410DRAFT_720667 [Rickenella mellea]|uniref:Pericentrin/AKAP-450 centrosomal targeting domain-containing protein n=1 Tax=Rickenella mellea TaxID=50990 RepID=A0A4Y7Q826_9AGAM|nr:hypothetical protein BD410DRAFT_720667 [Rickenella mellea]